VKFPPADVIEAQLPNDFFLKILVHFDAETMHFFSLA